MDMGCKVTVIIPTYQPKAYLWECLGSVIHQTFPKEDFEVIVVLNGSEEPWKGEIEQFITDSGATNIHFYYTPEPGVSNARNIALDKAQGEYVAFIDDDDYISHTYLEELYSLASKNVVPLCYPLSFVDGTNEFTPYDITQDYTNNKDNSPCSFTKAKRFFSGPVYKLIHRDIIGCKRFDRSFKNGEDSIFMFEISDKLYQVAFASMNAVYYRRIRRGSAILRKKSFFEVARNCIRMMYAYTIVYVRHPLNYSFRFYFTRILGAIHGAFAQFQLNNKE